MSLGTRQLALAVAALAFAAGLTACGSDGAADPGPASPTTTSAATESTVTSSEEPSTTESTSSVESATGIKLTHDLAEITLPKGWVEEDNFGVPFIRQGSDNLFGGLTFSELGGESNQSMTLDTIARRQLRLVDLPQVKRYDDVILGDGTNAYRLAGRQDKFFYNEYYGVLIGNFEYTLAFSFSTHYGTVKEAKELMASMLATFEFNP